MTTLKGRPDEHNHRTRAPAAGDSLAHAASPVEQGMSPQSDTPLAARQSAARGRGFYRPTLPRTAAFWSLAGVFCLLFVAVAAPAPL